MMRLAVLALGLLYGHAFAASPNVVLIMTDNHGAWTLGCYGNQEIRTPNIDRLAAEGTLFTNAFASNPVCSPTRATFLTGLLPSQHGVHCFLRSGRLQIGPQARNTLSEFTSIGEVLHDAGYTCGLVGKWHLGANLTPQEGFEDYWITMPHGGTSTFYGAQVIEKGVLRREPEYLTDFWSRHAVKFIEDQSKTDKPFFLFLAYNGPYALGRLLLREGKNRHAEYYTNKDMTSFPREPTHPWQFNNRDYHNNPVSNRRVATEVSGVDDGVGRVLNALDQSGVAGDTVVIFVADQGWVGGHGGFYGMGDHTRPTTARDGMMRIPMIWRHNRRIRASSRSDSMVSNYDFAPTLLSYLGLKAPPSSTIAKSPGRSFARELTDGDMQLDEPVYYEFENLRCIRTRDWKYVHRHPNGPHELYELVSDPGEFDNLVDQPAYAKKRDDLRRTLEVYFSEHADARYDLYNGGGSQTVLFLDQVSPLPKREPVKPPQRPEHFIPAGIKAPDGFRAELVASPPLVTKPVAACFDDRGYLFVLSNDNLVYQLKDRDGDGVFDQSTNYAEVNSPLAVTWRDGGLEVLSSIAGFRFQDRNLDGISDQRRTLIDDEIVAVGRGASTGKAIYVSGSMDHHWQGHKFLAMRDEACVVRLEPRDGTQATVRHAFLSSSHESFCPVDVIEDADGSLLVVDATGGIYRVWRTGMTVLDDPWGHRIDWERLSPRELVRMLNDTRFAVRDQAMERCFRGDDTVIDELCRQSATGDVRVRTNATNVLQRMVVNGFESEKIRAALNDAKTRSRSGATWLTPPF